MNNTCIFLLVSILVVWLIVRSKETYVNNSQWVKNEVWGDTDLNPQDIYFVQIGSHCGDESCAVCGEPIWADCKKNMWSGIVVEPIPEAYNKLKHNYSWNPNVTAIQCAVSDVNGVSKFHTDGTEASSLLESHVRKHGMKTYTIDVVTYNLNTFWDKFVNSEKVDILNTDCEGVDHTIILSTNFDKLIPKPRYILYESRHIPENEKGTVLDYLKKYNYEFVKNIPGDTLVKLIL